MRRIVCLLTCFVVLALTGLTMAQPPGSLSVQPPEIAEGAVVNFFQVAHTSVDVGLLDLYLANAEEPFIRNMAFGDTVDMLAIPADITLFIARYAGAGPSSEALASLEFDFGTNSSWVLLAAGRDQRRSFNLLPVPIPRSPNLYSPGQALVRSVSAVNDGSGMNIAIQDGNFIATGMGWLGPRDSLVPSGDYELVAKSFNDPFGAPTDVSLPAEMTTMLILIGDLDGAPPGQILALSSPPEQARVKIVNLQSEDYTVVFSPTDLRIEALDAGQTSEFVTVRNSSSILLFFPKGANPNQSSTLFTVPQRLRPGRDVVITLRNDGSVDIEETLTPRE